MEIQDLVDDIESALGVSGFHPFREGGQKIVGTAVFGSVPVIVKVVIVPEGPAAGTVLERAHREVELLAAVDSPAVVRVLTDAIEIDDPPVAICWVEEQLDGDDLNVHLRGPWSEDDAWILAEDLATALAACHELDGVHRDLSAANVRRLPSGRYVLMDPGLARHLARVGVTGLLQPGTLGWMSPEHAAGRRAVRASDVYCFGILLYIALTGVLPVEVGTDESDYFTRLTTTSPESVATYRSDLSPDLVELVDTCLQHQPARRYLDGAELVERVARSRAGAR